MIALVSGAGLLAAWVTVTRNERMTALFETAPSSTMTVIVTDPYELAVGANAMLAVVFGLVYLTVGFGISAGLLERALTVRNWATLVEPVVMPVSVTVCSPEFSLIDISAIGSSVGGRIGAGLVDAGTV